MRKYFFYILFIYVLLSGCEENSAETCGLSQDISTVKQDYKILFIGNSHTYTNNIPETIEEMALSNGDVYTTKMEAPGGYTFKQHRNRQATIDAIGSEPWDIIVLQGQGGIQALPSFMADTAIYQYAEDLVAKIKENSAETRIILYMTHGYKLGVLSWGGTEWCEQDPLVCDYEGMQQRVRDNTVILSEIIDAEVAPAGQMWKILMDENFDLELFSNDNLHASPEGSYISAVTLYAVISHRNIRGVYHPKNIDEASASFIQNKIDHSLYHCDPPWIDY